jgi:methionine salvage enolase-phosphatase E1
MNDRLNGFAAQVRITGEVSSLSPVRRPRFPLGRSRTSNVVVSNHLDALRPDIRATVERVAAERGIRLTDVQVVSPTKAIMP